MIYNSEEAKSDPAETGGLTLSPCQDKWSRAEVEHLHFKLKSKIHLL